MRQGLKRVVHRRDDAPTGGRWDRLEHLLAAYYRDAGCQVAHVATSATAGRSGGCVDLQLVWASAADADQALERPGVVQRSALAGQHDAGSASLETDVSNIALRLTREILVRTSSWA